jgi:hypothetical protein
MSLTVFFQLTVEAATALAACHRETEWSDRLGECTTLKRAAEWLHLATATNVKMTSFPALPKLQLEQDQPHHPGIS